MPGIILYVSGHGYGHATRSLALAEALRRLRPSLPLHVRTQAPHWIFTEELPGLGCSSAQVDVGMLQANGLDIDLRASLEAHERFGSGWDAAIEREASFLKSMDASLVVSDIPALPFAAAAAVGVPCFGASNFAWDWIVEPYAADEPRWGPVRERYARAYARAEGFFRLPFAGDFRPPVPSVDVPLVVRRARLSREEVRGALGISDSRPVVVVSFGGFGGGDYSLAREDLSAFRFIGFSPKPRGLGASWLELPRHSPIRHVDLAAACDALVSKPGFGTAAECIAHGTRLLYVPREGFRETPALVEGIRTWAVSRPFPRADFEAGRWRAHLEALLAEPIRAPGLRLDGAEELARLLMERL